MITSCPRCRVRLYINYYPDARTLVKARCPECQRLIKLWCPGWELPPDNARAMASLIKHRAHLDKLAEAESKAATTISEEIEEEFEQLLMPTVWDERTALLNGVITGKIVNKSLDNTH